MPLTKAKLEIQSDLTRTSAPSLPDDVANKNYVDSVVSAATPDATAASGGGVKGVATYDSDKGLDVAAAVVEVKVDGVTITFDGSGNLQAISSTPDATSAPGGGIKGKVTADENKGLKIATGIMEVFANTAKGLQTVATGLEVKVDGATVTFDGAGNLQAPGSGGATLVNANKYMSCLVTASDGDPATATTISNTPAGYIRILLNGNGIRLGDGVKVGVPCYFSADGGTTARAIAAVAASDVLYWNGSVAGFELDTSDVLDFDYEV
jgi:hypothetical protein